MPRRPLLLAAVLLTPAPAFALGEEAFGNAPRVKQSEWADGVVDVVNLQSRVYLRWVNGNEDFFYKGDAAALTEALKKFAEIKDDQKSVVILPGKGETKSFQGKDISFDWKLHVPTGIYRAMTKETHPILTIHVPAAKAGELKDGLAAGKAIADLDSPTFRVRDAAEAELRTLGRSAKPVLRAALADRPSAEKRQVRLEKLLKDLSGFDAGDLDIPTGLTVVGVDELIEKYTKGLSEKDVAARAVAVGNLAALAAYDPDVVTNLTTLAARGQHEYVRRVAVHALGQAGLLAKPALPVLKLGLDDPDKTVAKAYRTAVDQIEAAKESPTAEADAKTTKAILQEIRDLKKSREKK